MHRLLLTIAVALLTGLGSVAAASARSDDVLGPGRIEMPDHGYAITIPDDWLAVPLDQVEMDRRAAEGATELGVDPEIAERVASRGIVHSLEAFSLGGGDGCRVQIDESPESSAEERVAAAMGLGEVFGDRLSDGPDGEVLGSDGGDVAKIDYSLSLDEGDLQITTFMFDDGEILVTMTCNASERPADSWMSIAVTFEFLPAVGGG